MDNINYIYFINYLAILIGFVSRCMLRQLNSLTVAILKNTNSSKTKKAILKTIQIREV